MCDRARPAQGDRTVAIQLSEFSRQHELADGYAPGLFYMFTKFDDESGSMHIYAQRAVPEGANGQIAFMPLSARIEHTVHFDARRHTFGRTHLPLTEGMSAREGGVCMCVCVCMCA